MLPDVTVRGPGRAGAGALPDVFDLTVTRA
jgi:hypothetical protein